MFPGNIWEVMARIIFDHTETEQRKLDPLNKKNLKSNLK